MASADIVKSVSKDLKYYFQVKRLEDSFDLSGPNVPRLDHPPMKQATLIQYPMLYDRSLKHYFSHPEVRIRLTQLKNGSSVENRSAHVRKMLEKYLKQYSFVNSTLGPQAYMQTKRGLVLRPEYRGFQDPHKKGAAPRPFSGAYPLLTMTSPSHISTSEAKRHMGIASNLIQQTGQIDMSAKKFDTTAPGTKLQYLPGSKKSKSRQPRAQSAPLKNTADRNSAGGTPSMSSCSTYTMGSEGNGKNTGRKKKTTGKVGKSSRSGATTAAASDDRPPLPAWLQKQIDRADGGSQDDGEAPVVRHVPRPPPAREGTAGGRPKTGRGRTGAGNGRTSQHGAAAVTQTGGELLAGYDPAQQILSEGEACLYEVSVRTGGRLGSGTNADVFVTLYGERGRSPGIQLEKSTTHKILFQKNHTDEFSVHTPHVGALKAIQIGHDDTRPGSDWFLDWVSVTDTRADTGTTGEPGTETGTGPVRYTFRCNDWLSIRSEHKQTRRLLPVAGLAPVDAGSLAVAGGGDGDRMVAGGPADNNNNNNNDTSLSSGSEGGGGGGDSGSGETFSSRTDSGSSLQASSAPGSPSSLSTSRHDNDMVAAGGGEAMFKPESARELLSSRRSPDPSDGNAATDGTGDFSAGEIARPATRQHRTRFEDERTPVVRDESVPIVPLTTGGSGGSGIQPWKSPPPPHGIHEATSLGDVAAMQKLYERNADVVRERDTRDFTPLHTACHAGRPAAVTWLCRHGADLEARVRAAGPGPGPAGFTALHVAAAAGHPECCAALRRAGDHIDRRVATPRGPTPLHLAARAGALDCVQWLVQNNARTDVRDAEDRSAFDVARQHRQERVAKWLIENGDG